MSPLATGRLHLAPLLDGVGECVAMTAMCVSLSRRSICRWTHPLTRLTCPQLWLKAEARLWLERDVCLRFARLLVACRDALERHVLSSRNGTTAKERERRSGSGYRELHAVGGGPAAVPREDTRARREQGNEGTRGRTENERTMYSYKRGHHSPSTHTSLSSGRGGSALTSPHLTPTPRSRLPQSTTAPRPGARCGPDRLTTPWR